MRPVRQALGHRLGRRIVGVPDRIADLEVEGTEVVAVIVVRGVWGRLLGYERDTVRGPWILETVARAVLRRGSRRVAWSDARFEP